MLLLHVPLVFTLFPTTGQRWSQQWSVTQSLHNDRKQYTLFRYFERYYRQSTRTSKVISDLHSAEVVVFCRERRGHGRVD